MRRSILPAARVRAWRAFLMFTWGGEWAIPLTAQIKHNLTWFFFDGLFASASDNIIITYVPYTSWHWGPRARKLA